MRKVGFAALTVAFLLFLSVIPATSITWQTPIQITDTPDMKYSVSLFVDSNGVAHVAFSTSYFGTFGEVYYINNNGGNFTTPVQIPSPVNQSVGPSLAVDSDGYAHIAFYGGNGTQSLARAVYTPYADVYYSTNKGSPTSSFQTINLTDYSPTGSTSLTPDLALDSSGYVHIAWIGGNYDIYYANNTSGDFVTQRVTFQTGSPVFSSPTLAIDDDGFAHIVCYAYDGNDDELYYITNNVTGAAWSSLIPITNDLNTSSAPGDQQPDILIDDSGLIHIVWRRGFPGPPSYTQIFYTNFTQQIVSTFVPVSPVNGSDRNPSLALDSNNYAHVSWHNLTSQMIVYSNNTGGSFGAAEIVSTTSYINRYSSLFIDDDDYIHIAYTGVPTGEPSWQVFYTNNGAPTPSVSEFASYLFILGSVTIGMLIMGIYRSRKEARRTGFN